MANNALSSSHLFTTFSSFRMDQSHLILLFFFCFSFLFLAFSLHFISHYKQKKKKRTEQDQSTHQNPVSLLSATITKKTHKNPPLFVEILTSLDPNFASSAPFEEDDRNRIDSGGDAVGGDCERLEDQRGKKKKKRVKKKGLNLKQEGQEQGFLEIRNALEKMSMQSVDCSYPFTSSSSVTQRKMKQHYDQLVKSNEAKALTVSQVGQFVNCLLEARNELQHKSEIIQRRFTITKALLLKADRSSLDRIRQQIYKLEAERKRLEEDTLVYNLLQEQLKLSPAYKKMLEIGARMELKASSAPLEESPDAQFTDISFEEFLAQEKKDSFWQRNGKPRPCAS